MKYYMVADNDRCIWGVGLTKSEAQKDAKKELKLNPHDVVLSKAIECDKVLYSYIFENGSEEADTWTIIKGIARLDKFIDEDERKEAITNFKDFALHDKLIAIYQLLIDNKS